MTVAVLIPFSSSEPWRARARDHVVGRYQAGGYEVVEGACHGPWRKAAAVDQAARRTTADILVVADADCVCPIGDAVSRVRDGAPWAIPHDLVHRLDQPATEQLYTTGDAGPGRAQRPYRGFEGGGIVALRRAVWEQVPMDPRFEGWGGEDSSWAVALNTLVGPPWRGVEDLLHLWHPPAPRVLRRWGTPDNRALEIRYRMAARAGRRAMADLVAEARAVA